MSKQVGSSHIKIFGRIAVGIILTALLVATVSSQTRLKRNGKIAFTSDRDGNREIYVMNPDGSLQTRLTNNFIVDDQPTWSPDGRKIAFVSQEPSGAFAIFKMNADGSNRTEITPIHYLVNPPHWFSDFWAMSWSPDGNRIVFQDIWDIYVVNADGTDRQRLTAGSGYNHEPAWSPDGSTILFSSARARLYPTLYTMRPDGTDVQAFPGFNGNWEIASNWSPTGNKVLFVVDWTDEISSSGIVTANADGTNRQLFDGDGDFTYRNKPSWAPDGRKIIFDKWEYSTGDMEIYIKNTDGSGLIQLTDTPGWNFFPSWQSVALGPANVDFDGDGRSDISLFRPSDATWYLQQSTSGFAAANWGIATDKIVPADYDGDGKTDLAVYRASEGNWYVLQSSSGTLLAMNFGISGDLPTPADFDSDGKADVAVYRPSTGTWWISRATGRVISAQFGTSEDKPVAADYDGDGKAELAVFRPSNGTWYYSNDFIDPSHNFVSVPFGVSDDLVTPADFDGDGKTDVAVYRPSTGTWYRLSSSTGAVVATQFGTSEDIPTAADFDGDGRADISVFRPSDGVWYRLNSSNGSFFAAQFGTTGDRPTLAAFRY